MADFEVALPVGAFNVNPPMYTFTRTGIDGAEVILPVFGGDNFIGEVLAGKWEKHDDGNIVGPWKALITGEELQLTGASDIGGTPRIGWIRCKNEMIFKNKMYFDVHMELPSHSAANAFALCFLVAATNTGASDPETAVDYLELTLYTDATTYYVWVKKMVGAVLTTPLPAAPKTSNEGTWRVKFENVSDSVRIYYHEGTGDVDETVDEVAGSPFDLSLGFTHGFPYYMLWSSEATVRTIVSEKVTVKYPSLKTEYDMPVANISKGSCKCFDTVGAVSEADWVRVFDVDHVFTGDCVIQNGLMRIRIYEATIDGLLLYWYINAAWTYLNRYHFVPYLRSSALETRYPFLQSIKMLTPEKIILTIRTHDSAVQNGDHYVDYEVTLMRGNPYAQYSIVDIFPIQQIYQSYWFSGGRFGVASNAETHGIGDANLSLAQNNTTLTDNYGVNFSASGTTAICFMASAKKPNVGDARLQMYMRDFYWQDYSYATALLTKLYIGVTPFALIANLFKEAEDATLTGGASVIVDATASEGECAELNAQNEEVYWTLSNSLPIGRYLLFARIKDTNQIADDCLLQMRNVTDSTYLNEENLYVALVLTASWAYYQCVFDIDADDSGDTLRVYVSKDKVDANAIYVDYFLIVPVGNGESWPQDLAHNAMRHIVRSRRIGKHA